MLKLIQKLRADAHYGWAIFGLTVTNLTVEGATKNTGAVLFVALREGFGQSAAVTAGIFSLAGIVGALWAPLAGRLLDRMGPRFLFPLGGLVLLISWWASSFATSLWQLFFLFSLLGPLGEVVLSSFTATANLAPWFPKNRGRALGLADAGNPLGQALFTPVAQLLITAVGWRNTMRIYGLTFFLLVAPVNYLFQRRPPLSQPSQGNAEASETGRRKAQASPGARPPRWRDVARIPSVWCLVGARGCFAVGIQMLRVHLLAFFILKGYNELQAATAIGLVGVLSMVGRPILGTLSDRWGRELVYTVSASLYVSAIALVFILGQGDRVWPLVVFVGLAGITDGVSGLVVGAKAADLFPSSSLGTVMGLVEMGRGLGFAVGPILGGLLFDLYGNYLAAFSSALVLALVAVCCIWATRFYSKPSAATATPSASQTRS
ncbi:MAG: MFS transporter [SAR202 cluster bacterium]|nr:MFS transporter [SAR202 cluster bacterium]